MKYLLYIILICFIFSVSCSEKQRRIEEKKVFNQIGDSCINMFYLTLKKGFSEILYPPPPPDIILKFFADSIYAKHELNKLDTLGYPIKFSVFNFNSKTDNSVSEYYKAFDRQNKIRLNYICENIFIYDSLLAPNTVLLKEAIRNNEILYKEFKPDSLNSGEFQNKSKDKFWTKEKLNKSSMVTADLRPTNIKFYRVIFNQTKTKGVLILSFKIWGYLDGFACFDLEKGDQHWIIKDYHWFRVHRNDKRWEIK